MKYGKIFRIGRTVDETGKRENAKTGVRYLFSLHFNISNKSEINEGESLFCIYIFCTFAVAMKIKISCVSTVASATLKGCRAAPPREKFFSPTGEVKILS